MPRLTRLVQQVSFKITRSMTSRSKAPAHAKEKTALPLQHDKLNHTYRWRLYPPLMTSATSQLQPHQSIPSNSSPKNHSLQFPQRGKRSNTVQLAPMIKPNKNNKKLTYPAAKYVPRLNDDVYIRPKSKKELGIAGRIVAVDSNYNVELLPGSSNDDKYRKKDITSSSSVSNDGGSGGSSSRRNKKRKLTEDLRVSVQPFCFEHITENGRLKRCHLPDSASICERNGDGCKGCKPTKHGVRPSRLVPIHDIQMVDDSRSSLHSTNGDECIGLETAVVLTPDTTNYRQLATSYLRPRDKVFEIGCSTGECTTLMLRRLILLSLQRLKCRGDESSPISELRSYGHIMAFDTASEMIDEAKQRLFAEFNHSMPSKEDQPKDLFFEKMVQLHKMDAFLDPKGAYSKCVEFFNTEPRNPGYHHHPDIVLIDIGGNRELEGVVRMIQWVQSVFQSQPPRVLIVKSEAVVEELLKTIVAREEGDNNSLESGADSKDATNFVQSMKPRINVCPNYLNDGTIKNAQEWISTLFDEINNTTLTQENDLNSNTSANLPSGTACSKLSSLQKDSIQASSKYPHPKKAPLVLSPTDNETPICRFHNYDPNGCKKFKECPFDHDHCHWCGEPGHTAMHCKNSS